MVLVTVQITTKATIIAPMLIISQNTSSMKICLSLSTVPAFRMSTRVLSLPSRGSETYMSQAVHPVASRLAIRFKRCKPIQQQSRMRIPPPNKIKVLSHSLRKSLWASSTSATWPCLKRQWFIPTLNPQPHCLKASRSSSSQQLSDNRWLAQSQTTLLPSRIHTLWKPNCRKALSILTMAITRALI